MRGDLEIVNCFSVDVEGFVESNVQSFHIEKKHFDKTKENYEIENNINSLLELLNNFDVKATFFFVGRIAKDIPSIVKKVSQAGHEIACHSYKHVRIFGTDKDDFKKNVAFTKKCLEDLSGRKVYGFRAPDFSITDSSIWALDILREVGFFYDSSIYPSGIHDVYGIKETNPFIHKLSNGLIEFPLSTIGFFGRRFPFGGGGYFRLYPLFLTKICFSKINMAGYPCMFYIHPYEAGPVIPMVSEISYYRKFRHYYNCANGTRRLKEILRIFKFGPAIEILKEKRLAGMD